MVKTAGVVDILRSALAPAGKLINTALIFGSVAGRTENRSSDIDILVVGDIPFGDVVSLLSPAQKILGREINPVVYSPEEFISRVTKEHYFVKNILDGLRIFIIGDNDVLDRLVKSRAIGKTQARLQ